MRTRIVVCTCRKVFIMIRKYKLFVTILVATVMYAGISWYIPSSLYNKDNFERKMMQNMSEESRNWYQQRKELLSKGGATKLFLFSYMRGGSSVAGELFNLDLHATMWYEPGDALYSYYHGVQVRNLPQHDLYDGNMTRRKLNVEELEEITEFYSNIFSCQYRDLPLEVMAHPFLKESVAMDEYMACMHVKGRKTLLIDCKAYIAPVCGHHLDTARHTQCHEGIVIIRDFLQENVHITNVSQLVTTMRESYGDMISQLSDDIQRKLSLFISHQVCLQRVSEDSSKCLRVAMERCQSDSLRVVQVNRIKMEDLEMLIKRHPDIRIIHYIRDPRGIAQSRVSVTVTTQNMIWNQFNDTRPVTEARFLCHRMSEDLHQRHLLEKKYPGVFMELRYEDFVTDPLVLARNVYSFINRRPPSGWPHFVRRNMDAIQEEGVFDIKVTNVTETVTKWQRLIPADQLEEIQAFCSDFLNQARYH